MQIWLADFSFELTLPPKKTKKQYIVVKDVVCKRVPPEHIKKNSDMIFRALREISETRQKTIAVDNKGIPKVTITYTKKLGVTNEEEFVYG